MSRPREDRFQRLAEIVDEAPTHLDPAAFETWLEATCGGDAWLREQARELLGHRGAVPTDFLAPARATAADRPPPQTIGPFTVTRRLGRGGMGEVFAARDPEADRDVAIKLVHAAGGGGPVGAEILSRFENERRMLARMDHPGIARVWSVGRTEGGEPWLAMELVPGARDIVTAAGERGLDLRDRVRMMARVAEAVHHAHQRGVVHRDLKPGNIVVSDEDAGRPPRPRVIDFGVARLADEAASLDFRTRAGQLIGTQAYMAPEQARDPAGADVRCDVFALGTVLYELLAGRRAFTSAGGPPAVPLPDAGGPFPIPPDLDVIVRTAIAEDPEDRYGSAEALAADLRRFLEDAPIAARPATRGYLLRKFLRRHRTGVLVTAAVAITIVTVAIVATDQAIRATRAEHAATRLAYRAGIVAAAAAVRERDGTAAAAFLDEVDPELRGWEWSILDRQARGYRRRITVSDVYLETIALDGDGRILVRPTIPRARGRTDEPRDLEDILVLAAKGLTVDGSRAVVWGDEELRLVDTTTGTTLGRRAIPWPIAAAVIQGPDLLAIDRDRRLWRIPLEGSADPEPIGAADPALEQIHALAAGPDGSVLLLGDTGFSVRDAAGGRRTVPFPGARRSSRPVASPDGSLVAVGRADRTVLVLAVADGRTVAEFGPLTEPGQRLAFDHTGRRLAVAHPSGGVRIHRVPGGEPIGPLRMAHAGDVTAIGFDRDGRLLTADFQGSLLQWDVDAASDLPRVLEHPVAVSQVRFSDERTLETLTVDGRLRRWRAGEPGDAEATADPVAVAEHAWLTVAVPGGPRVWGTTTGNLIVDSDAGRRTIEVFDRPHLSSIDASPDGTKVALAHALDGLAVVDLAGGGIWRDSMADQGGSDVAWLDDRRLLAASMDGRVVEFDIRSGRHRLIAEVPEPRCLTVLAGGREPRHAIVGNAEGTLTLVSLPSGDIRRRIEGHGMSVSSIAVSPDGRRIASGDMGGTISIRDRADGQELLRLTVPAASGRPGDILHLAWSPGGQALVAAGSDGRGVVWAADGPWAGTLRD